MHTKLDSILGPCIRRSGSESVHVCLACGKEKLYVGPGGRWICFVCNIAGRDEKHATWLQPATDHHETKYHPDYSDSAVVTANAHAKARGIMPYTISACNVGGLYGCMAVPLYNKHWDKVGVSLYGPNNESPIQRYRTLGHRGIATTYLDSLGASPNAQKLLLFEGMFDWLGVTQELLRSDKNEEYDTVYCVGNQVSNTQIEAIFALYPSEIYICFDNDKVAPALALQRKLDMFHPTHLLLPPAVVEGIRVKDWDDVYKVVGERLLSYMIPGLEVTL